MWKSFVICLLLLTSLLNFCLQMARESFTSDTCVSLKVGLSVLMCQPGPLTSPHSGDSLTHKHTYMHTQTNEQYFKCLRQRFLITPGTTLALLSIPSFPPSRLSLFPFERPQCSFNEGSHGPWGQQTLALFLSHTHKHTDIHTLAKALGCHLRGGC